MAGGGELNTRLEYTMVIIDNWKTITIGVVGDRTLWIKRCSD